MHNSLLQSLGLSPDEANVYELMLELGVATIQKILPKSSLKRGTLYNVLRRLTERGLLIEKEGAKKATFEVASPAALEKFMSAEAARIEENKKRLTDRLPQLQSLYNLAMHRPNVQFFEGMDGVKKVLDDSLTTHDEIYSYADIESIVKHIDTVNKSYVRERERLGIKKRGIVRDSPFARSYLEKYYPTITTTHLLQGSNESFQSLMQIYDDKVSYITLAPNALVGVIITHSAIANMHKQIFLAQWNTSRPLPTMQPKISPLPPAAKQVVAQSEGSEPRAARIAPEPQNHVSNTGK